MEEQFPGFRIVSGHRRPDPALVAEFSNFAAANVSDAMGKLNTMDYRVKPIWGPPGVLCGPAFTVRVRPGDNAMCIKAIELAAPGDVIVVQDHWDTTLSIWGGIMSLLAKQRGIAGVITDGLVRDVAQTRAAGFPVWARGVTPIAPCRNLPPGQIGTQIVCGNVSVQPGDIILADEDGVVVIPRDEAPAILLRARQRVAKEDRWIEQIRQGELILVEPVNELLRKEGCAVVEVEQG